MKRLLLLAVLASALLTAWGCNNDKDRDDSTGSGEKQDRLDTVSGKPPG